MKGNAGGKCASACRSAARFPPGFVGDVCTDSWLFGDESFWGAVKRQKDKLVKRTLYIIATTSRSGSTHLCRMLTSTRRLGEPAEYYNVRVKPQRMKLWNVTSDLEYFQQVLLRTSTDNGVCGIKTATLA